MLWLTKALSNVGTRETQLIPSGQGQFVHKPYIHKTPRLLLKDSQSPITLSFRFECPDGANCIACNPPASRDKRTPNTPAPYCLYNRRIVFIDSCLQLKNSLANCISDLNSVAETTNTPLHKIFPATFAFATEVGYNAEQFQTLVSAKMQFPFSLCTSISNLRQYTTIPPIEFFSDKLSNRTAVDTQSYETFSRIWSTLKFQSLLDCLWLYSLADSTLLADLLKYHYIEIWRNTGLFPTFYLTAAGLALGSFLYNTKDPRPEHRFKRILLEFIPEDAEPVFQSNLLGGYVSNNAFYRFFSNGLLENRDFSTGFYVDANALYTTAESSNLPFSDYEYMDAQNQHSAYFNLLCQKLCNTDTKFFADAAQHQKKSFLFQVEVSYNLNMAKLVALDLSAFPELRKVEASELSSLQRGEFISAGRNLDSQPAKLVSDCHTSVITEHIDNLLFLLVWFSASIVRVKCCVQFTIYPFMHTYCNDMAQKRANSASKVQKSYLKCITNALAGIHAIQLIFLETCMIYAISILNPFFFTQKGRLHMKTESFLSSSIVSSLFEFERRIDTPDFFDAIPLGPSAAVIIEDGSTVSNTNVISISGKIYSTSKVTI